MRKKEHKPTPEDIKRMEEIMDSIVSEGVTVDEGDDDIKPYPDNEAPF